MKKGLTIILILITCISCKKPSREDVLKRCAMTVIRSAFGTFVNYDKKKDTLINDTLYRAFINIQSYNIANEYRERDDTITLVRNVNGEWKCQ